MGFSKFSQCAHYQGSPPPSGSIKGTLVYKATSATSEPRELSGSSPAAPAHGSSGTQGAAEPIVSALNSLIQTLTGSSHASPASLAIDQWLSSIAGVESSPELRQAMATMTFAGEEGSAQKFATSVLVQQCPHPLLIEN